MNLKIKSALLFSFFVFIILMSSAGFIYLQNEDFRVDDFNKRLKNNAQETLKVFSNEFDNQKTYKIDQELQTVGSLPNQRIAIFAGEKRLLFSEPKSFGASLTSSDFIKVKQENEYYFSRVGSDYLMMNLQNSGQDYLIVVAATDIYGKRKTENLKFILGFTVLGGLVLSGLLAFLYVRQIVRPLVTLQHQMQLINAQNLTQRVSEGKSNDEVSMIAKNFNSMLDRLQHSFEMRKSFVQHASHELRTPLASMLAQTEAALSQQLAPAQYHKILESLKEDQQDMINLTNSLLLLSSYEKLPHIKDGADLRLDELIYESIDIVSLSIPDAMIIFEFVNVPDNDNWLHVSGNEMLIKSAIQNLIRNAYQYSTDKKVDIKILALQDGITVKFENKGKQVLPEEQERLFMPFFRGENSMFKKGYGLGLSIVNRIITIHGGTVAYEARLGDINRFTIHFPANDNAA